MVKLWVARMQEMAHRAHIFKKIPRTPAYNKADHAFSAPGEGGGATLMTNSACQNATQLNTYQFFILKGWQVWV